MADVPIKDWIVHRPFDSAVYLDREPPEYEDDEAPDDPGTKRFDPHEPRDPHGRWTRVPGGREGEGPTLWESAAHALYTRDLHTPRLAKPSDDTPWADPDDPPLSEAQFWSMATFHFPQTYDLMQVAARNPEQLDDYLRDDTPVDAPLAQPYFKTVDGDQIARSDPRAAVELVRERLHLHDAIVKHGKRPPPSLARLTGMHFLPDDILADLEAGKTVYLEEDGFLTGNDDVPAVRKMLGEATRMAERFPNPLVRIHKPDAVWHISAGPNVKALFVKSLSRKGANEWIFAPGTRFSIKKGVDDNAYDVTIVEPPDPVPAA